MDKQTIIDQKNQFEAECSALFERLQSLQQEVQQTASRLDQTRGKFTAVDNILKAWVDVPAPVAPTAPDNSAPVTDSAAPDSNVEQPSAPVTDVKTAASDSTTADSSSADDPASDSTVDPTDDETEPTEPEA